MNPCFKWPRCLLCTFSFNSLVINLYIKSPLPFFFFLAWKPNSVCWRNAQAQPVCFISTQSWIRNTTVLAKGLRLGCFILYFWKGKKELLSRITSNAFSVIKELVWEYKKLSSKNKTAPRTTMCLINSCSKKKRKITTQCKKDSPTSHIFFVYQRLVHIWFSFFFFILHNAKEDLCTKSVRRVSHRDSVWDFYTHKETFVTLLMLLWPPAAEEESMALICVSPSTSGMRALVLKGQKTV